VAADDGQAGLDPRLADALDGAHSEGGDRLLLAFDHEGLESFQLEDGARSIEDGRGCNDITGQGAPGQAGSKVHRVTHHRVGLPYRGADEPAENMTAVDADAEGKERPRIHDA